MHVQLPSILLVLRYADAHFFLICLFQAFGLWERSSEWSILTSALQASWFVGRVVVDERPETRSRCYTPGRQTARKNSILTIIPFAIIWQCAALVPVLQSIYNRTSESNYWRQGRCYESDLYAWFLLSYEVFCFPSDIRKKFTHPPRNKQKVKGKPAKKAYTQSLTPFLPVKMFLFIYTSYTVKSAQKGTMVRMVRSRFFSWQHLLRSVLWPVCDPVDAGVHHGEGGGQPNQRGNLRHANQHQEDALP